MAAKHYSINEVIGLVDKLDDVIDSLMEDPEVDEFCFQGSDDEVSDIEET